MTLFRTIHLPDARRLRNPLPGPESTVSWRLIALASMGVLALITVLNLSVRAMHDFYVTVYRASAHLVTPTLIIGSVLFVVIMIGLVSGGGLRLGDLGWEASRLHSGLAWTAGIWITLQLIEVAASVVSGSGPHLSSKWVGAGWVTGIGILLGQALGTAPAEETFFRGFLLPQLRFRLSAERAAHAGAMAVVASQLVFALYHLPNLVMGNSGRVGTKPADIAVQLLLDLLIGVTYACLYLRTSNLFMVMGIHAVQNAGITIVATPIDPALVTLTIAVLLLLATYLAPSLARHRPRRGIDPDPDQRPAPLEQAPGPSSR